MDPELASLDPVLVLALITRAVENDIAPDDARKLNKLLDLL